MKDGHKFWGFQLDRSIVRDLVDLRSPCIALATKGVIQMDLDSCQ